MEGVESQNNLIQISGNLFEVRIVCTRTLITALKISYCSKFTSVVTFLGKVYQEIPNYYLGIYLELLKKNIKVIMAGPVMNRLFLKYVTVCLSHLEQPVNCNSRAEYFSSVGFRFRCAGVVSYSDWLSDSALKMGPPSACFQILLQ
jgi:hypothetical protein